MGLWIAKAVVLLHEGLIFAHSEGEGQGTVFTVVLPVMAIEMDTKEDIQSNIEKRMSSSKDFDRSSLPPLNLLVVDDQVSASKVLTRLLTLKGNNCFRAKNGLECIEFMKSLQIRQEKDLLRDGSEAENESEPTHIDCIMMDYEMDKMNGPDAAEELRRLGFKTLIVGVTGNGMSDDISYFYQKGADFVMQKPFDPKMFDDFIAASELKLGDN